MFAATAAFTVMSAFVKASREAGMSTPEVMVWRMAPGLPWVLVSLRRRKVPFLPRNPRWMLLRCAFGVAAMATNFWAVKALTLIQYTALHLTQPVFVAVGAPLFLRERLRGAAIVALGVALVGAALVIRPDRLLGGAATMAWLPGCVKLVSAALSAGAHLSLRAIAGDAQPRWWPQQNGADHPDSVVLFFTLTVVAGALAAGLADGSFRGLPPGLAPLGAVGLIAGMAGFGLAGQLLLSRAYARGSAPKVAIVGYVGIPLSVGLDVVAWGATPEPTAIVGALAMVAAGWMLLRGSPTERRCS